MVLFDATRVKQLLGETGTTNDIKIQHYGSMADTFVINDLISVKDMPNPPVVTAGVLTQADLNEIKNHATLITVAYFYKFESGDAITSDNAEQSWGMFFRNKFQRPRFYSTSGI